MGLNCADPFRADAFRELPAVMIAGQAGLVLGRALIGWGDRSPLKTRLRLVGNDVILLVLSMLLVWAGCVEGTLLHFHQPVVPYPLKIGFSVVELAALIWFLNSGSRDRSPDSEG